MFVGAIAAIDDGAWYLTCQKEGSAGGGVTDDDDIRGHGGQRHRRILQTLPLDYAAAAGGNVNDVCAEPFARDFEGGPRACTRLIEKVDDRLAPQRGHLLDFPRGHLEERLGHV
jgi:hypothetical protein